MKVGVVDRLYGDHLIAACCCLCHCIIPTPGVQAEPVTCFQPIENGKDEGDVTPMIRLLDTVNEMVCHCCGYVMSCRTPLQQTRARGSLWGLEEVRGNAGQAHVARNCKWPLGPEGVHQWTASKKGPSVPQLQRNEFCQQSE